MIPTAHSTYWADIAHVNAPLEYADPVPLVRQSRIHPIARTRISEAMKPP
jgi:hypothetical protein